MVDAEHDRLSITRQCRLMSIARSSFYYDGTGESPLNLRLMRLIDEQFLETPFYGSRQMTRWLRRQGDTVSRKRGPGRRQDRRWAASWSPEQIANRLKVDFPDEESMRISHEAIYQALYVQGRGALRRDLVACLRTGRALRVPRARTRGRGKAFVTAEIMISKRPAEADDRAVPGHWEGDLIVGLGSSAIGTLVERTSRFTRLLHLPRMDDDGQPRIKNGPALAGHGAEAGRDAIASSIITLPTPNRHRSANLLLRPTQPLATRHEREHQRPAAAVLSQRHRPVQTLS